MSKGLHYLSLTTAPIIAFDHKNEPCGHGTGFFHSEDEACVNFVTNWHVVTGQNHETPGFSKNGVRPESLQIELATLGGTFEGGKHITLGKKVKITLTLYDNEQQKLWFEHPSLAEKVDCVVLRVPKSVITQFEGCYHTIQGCTDFESQYSPDVTDTVFVIGYPLGLSSAGGIIPIWKRGSIASDPVINYDKLPCMLIDSRAFTGMSGSPVIVSHAGFWSPSGKIHDGQLGTVTDFIGVYSGRLKSKLDTDKDISDIGKVWKKEVIDEIIASIKNA